ncbi:hypothetical protein ERJ75_000056800 [Trypanosoma vivax]|nr:hypothetical protein TRVL_02994 [Trypanosoma vivax]KAH8620679.1 hypothetical protein ERJ75_000056800 [Trypanosoma vivax]
MCRVFFASLALSVLALANTPPADAVLFIDSLFGGISHSNSYPNGEYCGDYLGILKGRISIGLVPGKFDLYLNFSGKETQCMGEEYSYDEKTNVLDIKGAEDKNDCLGKMLHDNRLTLSVRYAPDADKLVLDFGIAVVELKKCN